MEKGPAGLIHALTLLHATQATGVGGSWEGAELAIGLVIIGQNDYFVH